MTGSSPARTRYPPPAKTVSVYRGSGRSDGRSFGRSAEVAAATRQRPLTGFFVNAYMIPARSMCDVHANKCERLKTPVTRRRRQGHFKGVCESVRPSTTKATVITAAPLLKLAFYVFFFFSMGPYFQTFLSHRLRLYPHRTCVIRRSTSLPPRHRGFVNTVNFVN